MYLDTEIEVEVATDIIDHTGDTKPYSIIDKSYTIKDLLAMGLEGQELYLEDLINTLLSEIKENTGILGYTDYVINTNFMLNSEKKEKLTVIKVNQITRRINEDEPVFIPEFRILNSMVKSIPYDDYDEDE